MKIKTIVLLFSACTVMCSCTKNDNELYSVGGKNGPALSSIIKFSNITDTTLQADSFSVTTITVQLNQNTDSASRVITFHTSLGVFSNNDTIITFYANSNGQAIVNLYSSIAGNAIVSASTGNISIDTTIQFTPALPTNMLLSASEYVADSSDSIHIYAQLFRNNGRVSNGVFVYFTTTRNNNADSLIIPNFALSQNGSANVTLLNPFTTPGYFTVTAFTILQSSDTLRKSINILIK